MPSIGPAPVPCNQSLHQTFDLIQQGIAFTNPMAATVLNLKNGGYSQMDLIDVQISLLDPIIHAADRTTLLNLKLKLVDLVGQRNGTGFNSTPLGEFLIWTDFTSGKTQFFPSSLLGRYSAIAGFGLLTSATMLTAISLMSGEKSRQEELCQPNPEDPCSTIEGTFGSIVGTFNTKLQQIIDFLSLPTGWLANAGSYTSQIDAFIADIIARVTAEITALASAIMTALNYALAKIFEMLKINPCVADILRSVGTNQLVQALNI